LSKATAPLKPFAEKLLNHQPAKGIDSLAGTAENQEMIRDLIHLEGFDMSEGIGLP
jgi:hypothetical protein